MCLTLHIPSDTTSLRTFLFLRDSSVTTGTGRTGLVYNTAGLTCYSIRPGASPSSVALATLASPSAAYSSGGFIEVDATNMPGLYRLDIPNALLAAGADSCTLFLKGASNLRPFSLHLHLAPVPADLRAVETLTTFDTVTLTKFFRCQSALYFGTAVRSPTGSTDDWKFYGPNGTQRISFSAAADDKNSRSSAPVLS